MPSSTLYWAPHRAEPRSRIVNDDLSSPTASGSTRPREPGALEGADRGPAPRVYPAVTESPSIERGVPDRVPLAGCARQTELVVLMLCPVVVGRVTEIRALDEALRDMTAGRGGCALICGEAGIGKSRLARELAARASGRGLRVVTGRAVPASTDVPYRPLTEVLHQLLRDAGPLDDLRLRPWLPALAGLVPALIGQVESAVAASAPTRGEALLQLLRCLAPAGVVVVLEDLHWADPDTLAVVDYLADNVVTERVLLAVTLRTDSASLPPDLSRRLRGRPGCFACHWTGWGPRRSSR